MCVYQHVLRSHDEACVSLPVWVRKHRDRLTGYVCEIQDECESRDMYATKCVFVSVCEARPLRTGVSMGGRTYTRRHTVSVSGEYSGIFSETRGMYICE